MKIGQSTSQIPSDAEAIDRRQGDIFDEGPTTARGSLRDDALTTETKAVYNVIERQESLHDKGIDLVDRKGMLVKIAMGAEELQYEFWFPFVLVLLTPRETNS